jgi:hypothetical protein
LNGQEVRGLGKRSVAAIRIRQRKGVRNHWTKGLVKGILFNTTYSGYMSYSTKGGKTQSKGEIIKVKSNYIEPIRSEETQLKLNAIINRKKSATGAPQKYNTPFLLTGMLRCKICGEKYSSRTTQSKSGVRYSYYFCEGKDVDKFAKPCSSKKYKKEVLEDFVLGEAKKAISSLVNSNVYESIHEGLQNKADDFLEQLKDIKLTINKTEKDLQAIKRLLYELDPESPAYEILRDEYTSDQTTLIVRLNELKLNKSSLEEKLDSQANSSVDIQGVIEKLKNFNKALDSSPLHLQKQILDTTFSSIEIGEDGEVGFVPSFVMQSNERVFSEQGEGVISFISKGTLATPKVPKDIKLNLTQNSYSVNFFEWLDSLMKFVRSSFFDFIVNLNPQLKKGKDFKDVTGYSLDIHFRIKTKQAIPRYNTMVDILSVCGKTIEEYIEFINDHDIVCSVNVMKVLSERRMY